MFSEDRQKPHRIVASHCCVCQRPLPDGDSLRFGMDSTCKSQFFNEDHTPSEAQVHLALGELALSDLPSDVIDACLKASERNVRTFVRTLIYHAAVNYDDREKVLTYSAVLRALGYALLADKMEQDRVAAIIFIKDDHIAAYLPGDPHTIREVQKIPGAVVLGQECVKDSSTITDSRAVPMVIAGKTGWKIPIDRLEHLKCLLGVFFGGQMVSYGDGDIRIPNTRPYIALRRFETSSPEGASPERKDSSGECSLEERGLVIEVRTPYNASFITALKRGVPSFARRWIPEKRVWEVDAIFKDQIVQTIQTHFGITVS